MRIWHDRIQCHGITIAAEPSSLFEMVNAVDTKTHAIRGSLSTEPWNKYGWHP